MAHLIIHIFLESFLLKIIKQKRWLGEGTMGKPNSTEQLDAALETYWDMCEQKGFREEDVDWWGGLL